MSSYKRITHLTEILETELKKNGLIEHNYLSEKNLVSTLDFLDHKYIGEKHKDDQNQFFRGAVVVSLPYDTTEPPDFPAGSARIGWFARYNHYKMLADKLKKIVKSLQNTGEYQKSGFRCLVNSGINEKKLAIASGLGFSGKNSLIVTPQSGCSCILGAILLPFNPDMTTPDSDHLLNDINITSKICKSCNACMEACPTKAIKSDSKIDPSLCIQYWASRVGSPPEKVKSAWGNLFYGCDKCINACPYGKIGRSVNYDLENSSGYTGAFVDAKKILDSSDEQIRKMFKGTTLGMSWIPTTLLKRNAFYALSR